MPKPKAETIERHNSNGNRRAGNNGNLNGYFSQIYTENYRKMLTTAHRILRNTEDAEDAVQKAFLNFYKHHSEFRKEAKVSTYLYKIVVNEALMMLRSSERRAHKVPLEHRFVDDSTIEIPELAVDYRIQNVNRINIERAVNRLDAGYRRTWILVDYLGCEHHEVAKTLGCSIGNSKSQLHKARKKLRKAFSSQQKPIQRKNNNGNSDIHVEAAYLQQAFLRAHPEIAERVEL